MDHAAAVLFACSLTAGAVVAQQGGAARYHLPAGEYSLAELTDQAELAVRRPIARSPEFAADSERSVRLQTGLQARAGEWQATLEALLYQHGFVLTFDAGQGQHEVVALPRDLPEWFTARVQELPLARLFDGGTWGPVRVTVPTVFAADDAELIVGPQFALRLDRVVFGGPKGAVTATGTAEAVRFALTVLAQFDPSLPVPAAAIRAWPRPAREPRVELARGVHTARELADRLAHVLHANVLTARVSDAVLDRRIDVADPLIADSFGAEDAIRKLLWDARLLVVEVPRREGLCELIDVDSRRVRDVVRCATPFAAAEVMARPGLRAFGTIAWQPAHLTHEVAIEAIGKVMAKAPVRSDPDLCLSVSGAAVGFRFAGMTHDLAALLAALAAADVAAAAQ